MILTHKNNDLYSAATSLGILCYSVDRETAADLIVAAVEGIELEDAYALLDSPANAAEWRATLMSAVVFDTAASLEAVDGLAVAADSELVAIKEQLAKVATENGEAKEIESLRQQIRDREASVREALVRQFGENFNPYWISWATRYERARLAELEAA